MREENMTKTIILGDLLSAGRIVIFNGRRTKAEVLNALIDRIAKEGDYGDRDDLEWAIFHRESLMSTGIGNGNRDSAYHSPERGQDLYGARHLQRRHCGL